MKQIIQKLSYLTLALSILVFTPDLLNAQCAAGQTAANFASTGAPQTFTVPTGVTSLTITAKGGDGGTGSIGTAFGGAGATVTGTFIVAPANSLNIIVGSVGGSNSNIAGSAGGGGGGGGGSAVVNTTTTTLYMVAGGGGGSSGQVGQGGQAVAGAGTGGAGGAGADASYQGSGGGGGGSLNAAGGVGATGGGIGATGGGGALGAAGGLNAVALSGDAAGGDGGYGAGGGGGGGDGDGDGTGSGGAGGGGGGGGFTGGAGSPLDGRSGGNGGGSYLDVSATAPLITAGADGGATASPSAGSVLICYTSPFPLSVNFIDFTVAKAETGVALNWKTKNEENNNRFEVMHSVDGIDFVSVATIMPKGEDNAIYNYDFLHKNAINGINYYRIKQVDNDGNITFTSIESIQLNNGKDIAVTINPSVTSTITTATVIAQKAGVSEVSVTNMKGQTVDQFNWTVKPGQQSFEINANNWAAGMHVIVVKNGNNKQVFKIIKK